MNPFDGSEDLTPDEVTFVESIDKLELDIMETFRPTGEDPHVIMGVLLNFALEMAEAWGKQTLKKKYKKSDRRKIIHESLDNAILYIEEPLTPMMSLHNDRMRMMVDEMFDVWVKDRKGDLV